MNISVVLKSTKKVACVIKVKNEEQSDQVLKFLQKIQRRLPNSYTRHKQSRKYCYNLDRKVQNVVGDNTLWISMYSGRQYVYINTTRGVR